MDSQQYATSSASSSERVTHQLDGLVFDIRRSVRYHSKRAAFFGRVAKFCTAFSLFTGFGTAASVVASSSPIISASFGVAVAFFSAIDLAFGFNNLERLHEDLKRRFIAFERSLTLEGLDVSAQVMRMKMSERLAIEADEPTIIRTLDLVCYNEQIHAQGFGKCAKLSLFRKMTCQFDLPFLTPRFEDE